MRLFFILGFLACAMLAAIIYPIWWGSVSLVELIWVATNGQGWGVAIGNCWDCFKDMRLNPMPKEGDEFYEERCGDYRLSRLGLIIHSILALALFCFMGFGLFLMTADEPQIPRIYTFTTLILPLVLIVVSISMNWASNFTKQERPDIRAHYRRARDQALALANVKLETLDALRAELDQSTQSLSESVHKVEDVTEKLAASNAAREQAIDAASTDRATVVKAGLENPDEWDGVERRSN